MLSLAGYELEILGDTPDQLAILAAALQNGVAKGIQALGNLRSLVYSERVEGFGQEKPYYLALHCAPKGCGRLVSGQCHLRPRNISRRDLKNPSQRLSAPGGFPAIRAGAAEAAKDRDRTEFVPAGFPKPITVARSRSHSDGLQGNAAGPRGPKFDPEKAKARLRRREWPHRQVECRRESTTRSLRRSLSSHREPTSSAHGTEEQMSSLRDIN